MPSIRFCKILIVDDSVAFRAKIKSILKDAKVGFYYYEAKNGKEGLSKYIETKPDIVVMDIMMPEVGGIKAMIAIKKYDPQATIVVASTRDNKDIIDEAIKSGGAVDYIIKPFVPADVVGAISKQILIDSKPKKKTTTKITRAFALQAR